MTVHKLQKSGRSFYVYMPTDWVLSNNLIRGSEVNINRFNNSIIINPSSINRSKRVITVSLKDNNINSLINIITRLFVAGFDEFTVKFNNQLSSDSLTELRSAINHLGLNMIDISSNSISLNVNLSINDLHKFISDLLYKSLNVVRMISNDTNNDMINHQITSFYYYRFMVLRSLYRFQLGIEQISIKPYEVNFLRTLAVNLTRLLVHLVKVNDESFINDVKHFLEKLNVVFDKPNLDKLNELLVLSDKLKIDENKVKSNEDYRKRRVNRCVEDIVRFFISDYLVSVSD